MFQEYFHVGLKEKGSRRIFTFHTHSLFLRIHCIHLKPIYIIVPTLEDYELFFSVCTRVNMYRACIVLDVSKVSGAAITRK